MPFTRSPSLLAIRSVPFHVELACRDHIATRNRTSRDAVARNAFAIASIVDENTGNSPWFSFTGTATRRAFATLSTFTTGFMDPCNLTMDWTKASLSRIAGMSARLGANRLWGEVEVIRATTTPATEDIKVCEDCMMIIANDDDSGMSEEQATTCREGIEQWNANGYYLCVGDSDSDQYEEFSRSTCDCCGQRLHGSRHQVVAMHQPHRNVPAIASEVMRESDSLDADHMDDVSAPDPHKWNEFYPDAAMPVVCPDCGQEVEHCLHQFQDNRRGSFRIATIHQGFLPFACGPDGGYFVIPPTGKVDISRKEEEPPYVKDPRATCITYLMFAHGHFPAGPLADTLDTIAKHIDTREEHPMELPGVHSIGEHGPILTLASGRVVNLVDTGCDTSPRVHYVWPRLGAVRNVYSNGNRAGSWTLTSR